MKKEGLFIRTCEFCKTIVKTNFETKRFCNSTCQKKDYNQRDEVKAKFRIYAKNYRKRHPEWKERHRILELTKHRERRARYWKEYSKRPEIRARIRENEKLRRKTDLEFAITDRLRRSLQHALTKYSKTGKIMTSKQYGLDWKKVIEHLKPFPEDIKNFEVNHIMPLHTFNLANPREVKRAFDPSNLQWLTREENRKKSGKLLYVKTYKIKEQIIIED